MNGLSERLLVSHYVNHYGGAVRRLNALRTRLASLDWQRTPVFEINGLKREELIAAGSVILHETILNLWADTAMIHPPGFLTRLLHSVMRLNAISAASRNGIKNLQQSPRRWPAVQAG